MTLCEIEHLRSVFVGVEMSWYDLLSDLELHSWRDTAISSSKGHFFNENVLSLYWYPAEGGTTAIVLGAVGYFEACIIGFWN